MICDNAIFIQNPWENKLLELVENVHHELFIINPFIKKDIIEKILASLKNKKLKILLRTNVYDMDNDVFDLECLFLLKSYNAEIRTIRNLHAKIFIFDNEKAIVTSSNLTVAGLNSNIEFGILIDDDRFVKENILPVVNKHWDSGGIIDTLEIDRVSDELQEIKDIKFNLSPFEFKPPKISTLGKFVSPMGNDESRENIDLSSTKKYKIITEKLMRNDMDKKEIISLIEKYFDKDYTQKNLSKIILGGLPYSFNSEFPFTTAGIYYKNALKVQPHFYITFSKSNANMFKNMIIDSGNTNVKIKTPEDYYRLRNEYFENFEMEPAKGINVFRSILYDEKSIKKILENIEYYYRIKNVLYFIENTWFKKLKLILLEKLEERRKSIINERQSEIRQERINILDASIQKIEEKIKLISQN